MVQANGVWTVTLLLDSNQTYEYGFVIDGNWTNDPANGNHGPSGNDRFSCADSPEIRGDQ
jgi:hypothetical protein